MAVTGAARQAVGAWARDLLARDIVILDTETTGLWPEDEIVEIAALNCAGEVLINQRIRPVDPTRLLKRDKRGTCAADIHGIYPHMLEGAPSFAVIYPKLRELLSLRPVVIYNADYDTKMLAQDCARHRLALPLMNATCAMKQFAAFWGEMNYERGGYRWFKLEMACSMAGVRLSDFDDQAHSALGDCNRTLALMQAMAASE